jgi:hypothetical protein
MSTAFSLLVDDVPLHPQAGWIIAFVAGLALIAFVAHTSTRRAKRMAQERPVFVEPARSPYVWDELCLTLPPGTTRYAIRRKLQQSASEVCATPHTADAGPDVKITRTRDGLRCSLRYAAPAERRLEVRARLITRILRQPDSARPLDLPL